MSENYEFLQYYKNPKENPLYERFLKKQLEFNSRTNLLTDTTIEQINSLRPDGTMVFTGYQSRGPYLNDGSTPEYYNVPLTTTLKNTATFRNTVSMAQKLERERRIINEVEPKPTRSQLRFITEEENLDNEVTNEIIKRKVLVRYTSTVHTRALDVKNKMRDDSTSPIHSITLAGLAWRRLKRLRVPGSTNERTHC